MVVWRAGASRDKSEQPADAVVSSLRHEDVNAVSLQLRDPAIAVEHYHPFFDWPVVQPAQKGESEKAGQRPTH